MNVDMPIEAVVQQLANAVDLTMNPSMPQDKRHEAYRLCDSFKNEFPLCIQCQCALYFTSDNAPYTDMVRHFGLQLMEHCIKFRWYQMSQEDKVLIKNTIMSLVNSATPALQINYLKDALARVVVEMIKREWPQHWPGMLNELDYATTLGFYQTETVMLIFLRLIEDVVILQTVDNAARRRDISKELQQNMSKIFPFFLNVIDVHCRQYVEYLNRNEQNAATTVIRVIQLALTNVGELFEFIQLSHVAYKDCYIITVLCSLIEDINFRQPAIECLSILLSRKCKNDEKECVMKFFDQPLHQLSIVTLKAINQEANDENNIFLKTLSKVISLLSSVLCGFWNDNKFHNFSTEESEKILLYYLELLLVLLGHNSVNIVSNINQAWGTLFKHPEISKNVALRQNFIPKWFLVSSKKLIKTDYKKLDPFSLLDFTDEESYNGVFYHCRAEIIETIKCATAVENDIMFSVTENLLKSCIEKTSTRIKIIPICESDSPEFLEWEVVVLILDGVVSKLLMTLDSEIVQKGLKLIELCLKFDTQDPLILSFLLSSVSALFIFLTATSWPSEYLHATLNKMYEYLILECHPEDQLYVPIKDLRFHSASLFIKLSVKFPNLLLPVFDKLCSLSDQLLIKTSKAGDHLNICLRVQEALIVLNNHIPEYDKQVQLIKHILEPCQLMWQKIQAVVSGGPEELLVYLGLDRPHVDLDSNVSIENRNHLIHCVNVLTSVMTRSNIKSSNLSNLPFISPVTEPVLLLLPNIFLLIKNFNSLCSNNFNKRMHPSFNNIFQIFPQERDTLLGKNVVSEKNDPFQMFKKKQKPDPIYKIKYSILTVYENCLLVLGRSCHLLGENLYALQNFAPSFIATIMNNAESLPHIRIRTIMKNFIKPFLINCSNKFYDSVLIPILNSFLSHMLIRLSITWQNIPDREENYDSKEGDSEELIEDMIIRLLTREYLELIRLCLTFSNDSKTSPHGSAEEISVVQSNNDISELGIKLLRNEQSRQLIVESILSGLSWNSSISQFWKTCQIFQWDNRPVLPPWSDSQSSFKANCLTQLVVKQLIVEDERSAMIIAPDLLIAILESLHWFGHHDSNVGPLLVTCLYVYETFRCKNDQLLGVFRKLPEINLDTLDRFDKWVLSSDPVNSKVNKSKRDMLKKILAGCIGKDVSQTHKQKAELRDLPRVHIPKICTTDLLENGDELNINKLQN
ncbi:exportin-5 [Daktulosphaira vitifoliae]|uniref:exportin-5 n=1 Tax=Daktulosphaira vitifoliae TaxID=58002 RepID=UPI0021AAD469|nr:exportin-5 [Daktulosphaira vitifoliae]XP_050524792.1 exportin-5 [Daktulosphaira vitifoliae]